MSASGLRCWVERIARIINLICPSILSAYAYSAEIDQPRISIGNYRCAIKYISVGTLPV